MAFIGQETVRKQQRRNFLWRMYTLIAVFVQFNRFIDLKINLHTNPYNLASSMLLWFWAPCVANCSNSSRNRPDLSFFCFQSSSPLTPRVFATKNCTASRLQAWTSFLYPFSMCLLDFWSWINELLLFF